MQHFLLNKIDKNKEIIIHGAGFAGLCLAYHLKKNNLKFKVIEKQNRVGGKLQTEDTPYGIVEYAANAIFLNDDVAQLLKELDLNYQVANKKLKRKLFYNHKVWNTPLNLFQAIAILLRSLKKIPKHLQTGDHSLHDFLQPWLGTKNIQNTVDTGLRGIYAATSRELSYQSIFSGYKPTKNYLGLIRWLKSRRSTQNSSGSASFEGGMQALINKLYQELKDHIILNCDQDQTNAIHIYCYDAHQLAQDFQSLRSLSRHLNQIEYKFVSSTTIFTKNVIDPLKNSFGILFSPQSSMHNFGILNNSEIFSNRAVDHYSSYTIIGPVDQDQLNIQKDIKKLGSTIDIAHLRQTRWERAIPIYSPKRNEYIRELPALMPPNTIFFSSFTNGVSLREMTSASIELAQYLTGYGAQKK